MRRGPDFIAKWIGKTPYIRSLSQNAPARVDLIEILGLQRSVEDRCLKEGMGAVATRAKGAEAPILKTTLYKQGNTVHLFPKTKKSTYTVSNASHDRCNTAFLSSVQ